MPARNHTKWKQVPGQLEVGEYVSSKIYSDENIFKKEMNTIFRNVWIPVCHESELPGAGDFRTTTIAGESILVVREEGNTIHAIKNTFERRPRGNMGPEIGFQDSPKFFHVSNSIRLSM